MALTICPVCGANISDKAKSCPHCKTVVNFKVPELITINVCEDCGFDIPDGFTDCPNCGCPVKSKEANSNEIIQKVEVASVKVPVKKKTKLMLIAFASVAAACVILLIVFLIAIPSLKYNKALTLLENDKYSEAIPIFDSLGNFKQSADKKSECYYLWGKNLFDEGMYSLALERFNNARGYSDSDDYIEKIDAYNYQSSLIDKLKLAYSMCSSSRTRMSYDKTSITVDSKNKWDDESVSDIAKIIVTLGISDSILDSMSHTTALMGRQSATSNGFRVEWSYHPDNGLDAIFTIDE